MQQGRGSGFTGGQWPVEEEEDEEEPPVLPPSVNEA